MLRIICNLVRKFPYLSCAVFSSLFITLFYFVIYINVAIKNDMLFNILSVLLIIPSAFVETVMTHYAEARDYMEKQPFVKLKDAWNNTKPSDVWDEFN